MEHDNLFFCACPVLDAAGWSYEEISDFLIERHYSCCKATVCRDIKRFKETGCPLELKRGRPRKSEVGKCTENSPIINNKLKFETTHLFTRENTYGKTAEKLSCCLKTIYNRN